MKMNRVGWRNREIIIIVEFYGHIFRVPLTIDLPRQQLRRYGDHDRPYSTEDNP